MYIKVLASPREKNISLTSIKIRRLFLLDIAKTPKNISVYNLQKPHKSYSSIMHISMNQNKESNSVLTIY